MSRSRFKALIPGVQSGKQTSSMLLLVLRHYQSQYRKLLKPMPCRDRRASIPIKVRRQDPHRAEAPDTALPPWDQRQTADEPIHRQC